MDKAIPVGSVLLVGFVALVVQAEIMSALQGIALSSIDPAVPLSQLMSIVIKSIFNPVTGFASVLALSVVGMKSIVQN